MSRRARPALYAERLDTPNLLPAVWTLRDVPDVEGLCRGVVAEKMHAWRAYSGRPQPEPVELEDVLLYLLEQVLVLERVYVAAPGIAFRPWLYQRLRFRILDYWRREFGRRGEKRIISLDAPVGATENDGDPGPTRLDLLAAGRAEDDPTPRALFFGGLLSGRDRPGAGHEPVLGGRSHRRAARGDRSAARAVA